MQKNKTLQNGKKGGGLATPLLNVLVIYKQTLTSVPSRKSIGYGARVWRGRA